VHRSVLISSPRSAPRNSIFSTGLMPRPCSPAGRSCPLCEEPACAYSRTGCSTTAPLPQPRYWQRRLHD